MFSYEDNRTEKSLQELMLDNFAQLSINESEQRRTNPIYHQIPQNRTKKPNADNVAQWYIKDPTEQQQQKSPIYQLHQFDGLRDFILNHANTDLKRTGKKSSVVADPTVNVHGVEMMENINISSYHRLSKDDLILLLVNLNHPHRNMKAYHTMISKDAKVILLQKLIDHYYHVLNKFDKNQLGCLIETNATYNLGLVGVRVDKKSKKQDMIRILLEMGL
jgi:hypothetical protein